MSNVSVEYLVLRDNVEYSRLTAFKGGGAAISVTADAAVLSVVYCPPMLELVCSS